MSLIPRNIIVPVCPEQLGGLSTPRLPSSIVTGDGTSVLSQESQVIDAAGDDVTSNFIHGAHETANIARYFSADTAVMKEKSPSCGVCHIMRKGNKIIGSGVAAALLRSKGLTVISSNLFTEEYVRYNRIWK